MTTRELDRLIWVDLLGVPYLERGRTREGMDCYGLAVLLQRRQGRTVADPPVLGAWARVESPEPGDAVLMRLKGQVPDHVATLISGTEVFHILEGGTASKEPLADYSRHVVGFFRAEPPTTAWLPPARRRFRIVRVPDPIGMTGVRAEELEWSEGTVITELLAGGLSRARWTVDGYPAVLGDRIPEAAEVVCWNAPRIPVPAALIAATGLSGGTLAFIGNIFIATGLGLLATLVAAPQQPRLDSTTEEASPSFNLDGIRNTVANGTTIPVVFGETRVGGQFLQTFFEVDAEFRSTLFVLLCISEGEIESIGGIAQDVDRVPASSIVGNLIEIDGNPISAYPTARVSVRLGKPRQSVIPGFENQVTAFGQSVTLRATSPLVPGQSAIANNDQTFLYTTTQPVDGFALQVRYPIGLYKIDATDGDEEPYSVYYTLRYQRKNQPGTEIVEVVIHGPSQKKADHTRTIKRTGLARDVWEIRITRMSDNDENMQRRYSVSQLIAVNEYASGTAIARNGKALLGIELLNTGQLSGAIPNITNITKGKKVPILDTGASLTAPTFTRQWSANPAWVALELITNPIFAGGAFYTLDHVDLPSLKEVADYCDESITTSGTNHKRWEFDYNFDSPGRLWDQLAKVMASCRSTVVLRNGKFFFAIERAASPTQLFTMGNTFGFRKRYLPLRRRANMVQIQYRNRRLDYDSDLAQLDDLGESTEVVREDMSLAGVVTPERAYRAAKYTLNVAQDVRWASTWETSIEGLAVRIGSVARVAHDTVLPGSPSGRVLAGCTTTTLRLDRDVTVPASPAWTVVLRVVVAGAPTLVTATPTAGTYASGDDIPISAALAVAPARHDLYAIGPSTTVTQSWRITSIEASPDQRAVIQAVEYVASVYDDDPGTIEGFTEVWPRTGKHLAIPSTLRLVEHTSVNQDGTVDHAIDVEFPADIEGAEFDVWIRKAYQSNAEETPEQEVRDPATAWILAGSTRTGELRIRQGIAPKRPFLVSVTPRSVSGRRMDPAAGRSQVIVPLGRTDLPNAPSGVEVCHTPQGLKVCWTPSPDRDVAHYEVRQTYDDGRRWILSDVLARCVCACEAVVQLHYWGDSYISVTAISRSGRRSLHPAYALIAGDLPTGLEVLTETEIDGADGATLDGGDVDGKNWITNVEEATWISDAIEITTDLTQVSIALDADMAELQTEVGDEGYLTTSPHAARLEDGVLLDAPDVDFFWPASENHYPAGGGGAATNWGIGAFDWDSVVYVTKEYSVSSNGSDWEDWVEYCGPFPLEGWPYIRVRLLLHTDANAWYQIILRSIVVQQVSVETARRVRSADPNSHFAGANQVDARLEELGYDLAEGTRRWPGIQQYAAFALYGGTTTYVSGADNYGKETSATVMSTIGVLVTPVPKWYLPVGSEVFKLRMLYWVDTVPGATQVIRVRVRHRTCDGGDANWGSYTSTNWDISVPTSVTINAPLIAEISVTSGSLGSGDEQFQLTLHRLGDDAADTYSGKAFVAGIQIISGVKHT